MKIDAGIKVPCNPLREKKKLKKRKNHAIQLSREEMKNLSGRGKWRSKKNQIYCRHPKKTARSGEKGGKNSSRKLAGGGGGGQSKKERGYGTSNEGLYPARRSSAEKAKKARNAYETRR